MLHLIFQSPLEIETLQRVGENNAVLFLEKSVVHLLKNGQWKNQLIELMNYSRCYALKEDLMIRGIQHNELLEGIEIIDYEGFVDLTVKQPLTCSWT